MPAVSKKQRRLAGMALRAKEGKGPAPFTGGMMKMSKEDLKHYASTPEAGLPKTVRKGKAPKKGKAGKRGKKR